LCFIFILSVGHPERSEGPRKTRKMPELPSIIAVPLKLLKYAMDV